MRAPELLTEVAVRPPAGGHAISKGQSYIRDVLLGDDHMEPREIKLYG